MSDEALLLDVGNTRIKWGLFAVGRITRTGSIERLRLKESGLLTTKLPRRLNGVVISNVAGTAFSARLSGVLSLYCDSNIHFAQSERETLGLKNAYAQPRKLGVDRWMAMLGARSEVKGSFCLVDAGTAVTIDVVDGNGTHLGGQILPGLALMNQALERNTGKIALSPRLPRRPGKNLPTLGKSTRTAVSIGTLNAVCGAVERSLRKMRVERLRPKIILTGGDAPYLLKQLDGDIVHRPHLVLQGLASIWQDRL